MRVSLGTGYQGFETSVGGCDSTQAHWCASVFSVCSVCNVYYVRVFCCMVCGCFCKEWMVFLRCGCFCNALMVF
jgi:hypothetical protein